MINDHPSVKREKWKTIAPIVAVTMTEMIAFIKLDTAWPNKNSSSVNGEIRSVLKLCDQISHSTPIVMAYSAYQTIFHKIIPTTMYTPYNSLVVPTKAAAINENTNICSAEFQNTSAQVSML